MQITIKTVAPKLSFTILRQMQEATFKEINYALENGKIYGYINNVGIGHHRMRVFLIGTEDNYRVVTNYQWKVVANETEAALFAFAGNKQVKKPFSTEHAAIAFLEAFNRLKTIALNTQIYIH